MLLTANENNSDILSCAEKYQTLVYYGDSLASLKEYKKAEVVFLFIIIILLLLTILTKIIFNIVSILCVLSFDILLMFTKKKKNLCDFNFFFLTLMKLNVYKLSIPNSVFA